MWPDYGSLTAARFGGVSVPDLVKKGEELLKDQESMAREPALPHQLTTLRDNWRKGELNAADAVALVRLAGFKLYLAQPIYPQTGIVWKVPKGARLADLLRRCETHFGYRIKFLRQLVERLSSPSTGQRSAVLGR